METNGKTLSTGNIDDQILRQEERRGASTFLKREIKLNSGVIKRGPRQVVS